MEFEQTAQGKVEIDTELQRGTKILEDRPRPSAHP